MEMGFVEFRNWFWAESFWLPPNVTWRNLERNDALFLPDVRDLTLALPMAVCVFCVRLIWERCVALPLGRLQKFRETPLTKPVPNKTLENAFAVSGKVLPDHKQILALAKILDWTPHAVEGWWRKRRMLGKTSQMQRFKETSWRFVFYFCIFWYGFFMLWSKPWLWDTKYCWHDYPRQHVPGDIWWYYMIQLSFYLSLVLSLFRDVKRKDSTEMIIHHIAAIALLILSWTSNMIRIGTLIICLHDTVDYWMEGAKLAKYCRYNRLCNCLFVVFTLLWFVTRIIIYPFRLIRSTMFEGHLVVGMFPLYYIFNGLLCTLQVLHIIWFYMILNMFYQYLIHGKIKKDDRSDTEPDSDSDDAALAEQNQGGGGEGMRVMSSTNHMTTLANNIRAQGDGISQRKNCVAR